MRDLIQRLRRRSLWAQRLGDRGAIGVLVAILIGGGVLIGIGAMAIDVGQLYQERAELQNGADAAALGVAKNCANGSCTLASAATTAGQLADANASALTSHDAGVPLVCGSAFGGCPTSSGAMTDCPSAPSGGVNYVDVHTATQTPSGNFIPPVFARTMLGNSSYQGTQVFACAQAEWGAATAANTLSFTISVCQWDSLTSGGGSPWGVEIPVIFKGSAVPCGGPGGQEVPGGWGWLNPNGGGNGCQAQINLSTSTTASDPGNKVPGNCAAVIQADVASNATVFIPIFDSVSGTGSNATYHLIGLAAFVLNGYQKLPGVKPDVVPASMKGKCTPSSAECLFGYFTQDLVPVGGGVGTGPNYGASAIKLSG